MIEGAYLEALEELKTGHKLGSIEIGWSYPSAEWVATSERCVALDAVVQQIVSGKDVRVSPAQKLELAEFCLVGKRMHTVPARLFREVWQADPSLFGDARSGRCYNAACAAARAAVADRMSDLNAAECVEWREQAREWLNLDLESLRTLKPTVGYALTIQDLSQTLSHWLSDPDLASVRDDDRLAQLPEAEQAAWRALWADVRQLLAEVQGASSPSAEASQSLPPAPPQATPIE